MVELEVVELMKEVEVKQTGHSWTHTTLPSCCSCWLGEEEDGVVMWQLFSFLWLVLCPPRAWYDLNNFLHVPRWYLPILLFTLTFISSNSSSLSSIAFSSFRHLLGLLLLQCFYLWFLLKASRNIFFRVVSETEVTGSGSRTCSFPMGYYCLVGAFS